MRTPLVILLSFFAAVFVVSDANYASAQLSIFQTEEMAQLHCPSDVVVWLDFSKRRYYLRGQRLYGKGRSGVYACREEARQGLNKRSWLGLR